MFRNRSVDVHQFAMIPRAEIPRSSFKIQKTYKTTFDAGYLIPIFCEEILPGDTFNCRMTAFARLATPLFPIMDNLYLESFFFFVPNRLLWSNWVKFMGEQLSPADSISFSIPQVVSPASGYVVGSIFDYFGLPTVGQVTGGATVSHSALPLRAYNRIINEWFRDENLNVPQPMATNDGPDLAANYGLVRRGKRHDYFTSCLPWTQKGGTVALPLTGNAVVRTQLTDTVTGVQAGIRLLAAGTGLNLPANSALSTGAGAGNSPPVARVGAASAAGAVEWYPSNLYADLSTVTNTTINALRLSFQIQRLLERDARGGTRYTEIVRSHFGVVSPDARLQRPEYLGGGSSPININPVTQNTQTGLTGGASPMGSLAAFGTALARNHGFSQSFTEHGYVIGLINVRADLTYQQGIRKLWDRRTRYDFYFPVFSMLGEQAVLNREIYCVGSASGGISPGDQDQGVFGYQERWAEYRYNPSQITGLFRSTSAGTIDPWHLSQRFTALPTLNTTFIDDTPPLSRIIAVGAGANGQQLLLDAFFDITAARPMPLYSVPGLIDHF